MEIVHVIRQYKPSIGGLEAVVFNLCKELSTMHGVRVRIVTLNRVFTNPSKILPRSEIIDGIEVTRIGYFGSNRYPIALGILNSIKSADIVHVHAIDFFYDFLAFTKWIHKKPLVASTHGGFFHTSFAAKFKKVFFNTFTRFSSKFYNQIFASSENDASTFSRISKNVILIENGVDVEKWKACGSKIPTRNIVFIGRWSNNKRVPLLIHLLVELCKLENWHLHIIGMPSDETVDSLIALAAKYRTENNLHIHAALNEIEIGKILCEVSYIASASAYEGFGVSIVEGLSAGLIPIVSIIPPFEKLLMALGFGNKIIPDDLETTAANIEQEHKNSLGTWEVKRNRCIDLSELYAWNGIAKQFKNAYFNQAKHTMSFKKNNKSLEQ